MYQVDFKGNVLLNYTVKNDISAFEWDISLDKFYASATDPTNHLFDMSTISLVDKSITKAFDFDRNEQGSWVSDYIQESHTFLYFTIKDYGYQYLDFIDTQTWKHTSKPFFYPQVVAMFYCASESNLYVTTFDTRDPHVTRIYRIALPSMKTDLLYNTTDYYASLGGNVYNPKTGMYSVQLFSKSNVMPSPPYMLNLDTQTKTASAYKLAFLPNAFAVPPQ